jgi:ribosome modulation factor
MKTTLLRITGLCALVPLLFAPHVSAAAANPNGSYTQDRDRDWDRPDNAWNDIQRRGFHDGIEGARHDIENHRQPNVNNRDEFRHPDDVPPPMRHAYREAFRRGYDRGISHFMNGPMAGARPVPRAWDAVPDEFDALRRQGFQDGIEGARRDYGNHRRPDVNNRDEYRHPHLPPEQREAYREGFRRGYQVGINHLMNAYDRR